MWLVDKCSGQFSLSRSRHVPCRVRRPKRPSTIPPASPTRAQKESRFPPGDHIDPEPPIRIINPVGAAQLFRGFYLHSEDPLWRCISLHDEDFFEDFHSSNRSTTRSPRIKDSVAHSYLSPRSRCYTTQAIVITLQLSGQLLIRMDFSVYQSKQSCCDQNSYKGLQIRSSGCCG